MKANLTTLGLSTLLAVLSLATGAAPTLSHAALKHVSVSHFGDNSHVPVVVVPTPSSVSPGDSVSISISLDGPATSDLTVYLGSNSSAFTVPSSVVVPSGQTSTTAPGYAPPIHDRIKGKSTSVTLTASCNGGSAQAGLTVN